MNKLELKRFTRTMLKYGGVGFEQNILYIYLYIFVASCSIILLLILGILEIILNFKGIDTLTGALETICPCSEFIYKGWSFIYYFQRIKVLFNRIDTDLWPLDKFGETVCREQQNLLNFVAKCLAFCLSFAIFTDIIIYTKPFYSHDTTVTPFTCYPLLEQDQNYVLMYVWNSFNSYQFVVLLLGTEAVFLTFVAYIVSQFTMLKHALMELKHESTNTYEEEELFYQKIKEYVDHHNLLLEFVKELNDVQSFQFMVHFLFMTLSVCIAIYIFATAGLTDLPRAGRSVTYIILYLSEFFLTCYAGSQLTHACDISDAIYDCGWEHKPKRIKTSTKIMLRLAHKPQILTGGKIFPLNLTSYVSVINMSFSVYTFLKTVKENDS